MTRYSLYLIFSLSVDGEDVVKFEADFYAVRYMWSLVKLKMG